VPTEQNLGTVCQRHELSRAAGTEPRGAQPTPVPGAEPAWSPAQARWVSPSAQAHPQAGSPAADGIPAASRQSDELTRRSSAVRYPRSDPAHPSRGVKRQRRHGIVLRAAEEELSWTATAGTHPLPVGQLKPGSPLCLVAQEGCHGVVEFLPPRGVVDRRDGSGAG
jgi:hypothetical protein